MSAIVAPLARVLLRYVGGALIASGFAINPATLTDPDVVQVACFFVGAGCTVLSEGWWALARSKGWTQ